MVWEKSLEDCISQDSSGNEINKIYIDIQGENDYGNQLTWLQKARSPAICKLDTWESQCCDSVWVSGLRSHNHCFKSQCLKAWEPGASCHVQGQLKKRVSSLFLCLFVLFGPQWRTVFISIRGEPPLFNLLVQMLICSRNTLTDTPRKKCFLAIWISLSPGKLTHELNHHKDELSSVVQP